MKHVADSETELHEYMVAIITAFHNDEKDMALSYINRLCQPCLMALVEAMAGTVSGVLTAVERRHPGFDRSQFFIEHGREKGVY